MYIPSTCGVLIGVRGARIPSSLTNRSERLGSLSPFERGDGRILAVTGVGGSPALDLRDMADALDLSTNTSSTLVNDMELLKEGDGQGRSSDAVREPGKMFDGLGRPCREAEKEAFVCMTGKCYRGLPLN